MIGGERFLVSSVTVNTTWRTYLIGDLQRRATIRYHAGTLRSRLEQFPSTVSMLLPEASSRLVKNRGFRDLGTFAIKVNSYSRNSYRYRICHIYETVKLNQIEPNSSIAMKVKKDLKLSLNMV